MKMTIRALSFTISSNLITATCHDTCTASVHGTKYIELKLQKAVTGMRRLFISQLCHQKVTFTLKIAEAQCICNSAFSDLRFLTRSSIIPSVLIASR